MYPRHGGRFTGEPAYFKHVVSGAKGLMERTGTTSKDYTYAVFHQPNGKFPTRVAKQLGFTDPQIMTGLLAPLIGNTYSGSVPLGLAAILDEAKPGDRICAVAYGSGAGSDAFDIKVTDEIEQFQRSRAPTVKQLNDNLKFLDYATYAKFRGKIILGSE
jgi:hydroxymethylglutaryl-CoA synthase